jgi:hypothetical protein
MPDTIPDTWAIVELLGHVRLAGKLSEEEKFGAKMGRLDIPTSRPCTCANASKKLVDLPTIPCDKCGGAGFIHKFITQFFGGGSVYRISIVSEDVARHVAATTAPAPVSPWDFPKRALPAPPVQDYDGYEEDEDD